MGTFLLQHFGLEDFMEQLDLLEVDLECPSLQAGLV
jgi:hypothetical protein